MSVVDQVRDLIAPVLVDLDLSLYDLEFESGILRVLVDRAGGVDIDAIATASRLVSRELDAAELLPGSYTLEVSSPGLERPLRTPAHFDAVVGREVTIKTVPTFDGPRRVAGVLTSTDDTAVSVTDTDDTVHRLEHTDIAKARTVFAWADDQRSGPARSSSQKARSR